MKTYSLTRKQFLPISIQYAWDFFSSPKNLSIITPKRLNFEILTNSGKDKMFEGQIIQYKISVVPFLRTFWETEIIEVKELESFTDIQRRGPYSIWKHKHNFVSVTGGTLMVDELEYAVPLGIVGRMINHLYIRKEVEGIFNYRFKVLENYFKNQDV